MNTYTGTAENYLSRLSVTLNALDRTEVDHAIGMIARAWQAGRQIITLGNGGSSLTALHFINDWNKSIYLSTGKPFRGRSLVDNIGLMMAYANDVSFEDLFVEQLRNILEPEDLVIAISGSGNSKNVIKAVQYANDHGAATLGLCGYSGGELKRLAHHAVWARVDDMQLAEDVHSIIGHIVMQKLCDGVCC